MIRRPPVTTRNATLFPDTTLCRSTSGGEGLQGLAPGGLVPRLAGAVRGGGPPAHRAGRCCSGGGRQLCRPGRSAAAGKPPRRPRGACHDRGVVAGRSEEHTSELQSLMRTSYAAFCLKKKKHT